MKKQRQKPHPEPCRIRKPLLSILRLAGVAAGGIILLCLFHLVVIGLPSSITQRIGDHLHSLGIPLRLESVRLIPFRGWECRHVRLFSTSPDNFHPLLDADVLSLQIGPVNWLDWKQGWSASLRAPRTEVCLGPAWDSAIAPDHPLRSIRDLQANFTISPSAVQLTAGALDWGPLQISGRGDVTSPEKPSGKKQAPPEFPPRFITRHAPQLEKWLSRVGSPDQIKIDLTFDLFPATPADNRVDTTLVIKNPAWNGRSYEQLAGVARLEERSLRLRALQLMQNSEEKLTAAGSYNLTNQTAFLTLENSLSADALLPLLPAAARDSLSRLEITPYGTLDFHATLGPAQPPQLLDRIELRLREAQLTRKDLTLAPLAFRLLRTDNRLQLRAIRAKANGGDLSGEADIDLDSKAWSARAKSDCDPHPVGTLAGGELKEFIDRFVFPTDFPELALTLSQDHAEAPLHLSGTLAAREFLYAEMPVDRVQTSLSYSNQVLVLDNLQVSREDRQSNGRILIDFDRDISTFDAAGSLTPATIAHLAAPDFPTVFEKFRFNGPFYAVGRGQIDFGSGTDNLFEGRVWAERIGLGNYEAAELHSRVIGSGTRLTFTNSTMQLCSGFAEGHARFDLEAGDHTAPYSIHADIAQLNLSELFQQASLRDYRTRGTASATLDLSADAKKGFWESAKGHGVIEIEKGQLSDLPLLGGFSRLMRTTLPGFSLFSITTLYSEFQIRDGALHSDRVELGGDLLSAYARGKYTPESGLDFVLQAEPLRQTRSHKKWYQLHLWLADALKWGSSPLFRFFEFELDGPLDNPEWRFVNIPSELSGLMRPGKGAEEK